MPFSVSLQRTVDELVKVLKTKAFKSEKFLDTAIRGAIRFLPESSDGFLNLRWNYSPLKEKAVPLPGGLFVSYQNRGDHFALCDSPAT